MNAPTVQSALRNLSGNNTYNGFVYLDSDSRITADAGTTLTIANTGGVNATIMNGTSAGKNLAVSGAGDVVVAGGIGAFVNNIAKTDTGTLTLAGNNSYAGATTIVILVIKIAIIIGAEIFNPMMKTSCATTAIPEKPFTLIAISANGIK